MASELLFAEVLGYVPRFTHEVTAPHIPILGLATRQRETVALA